MPPISTEELAAEAMAHFFLGLMKADGVITAAEEEKMLYLSQEYKDELPCSFTLILSHLEELRRDASLVDWHPEQHMGEGLHLFDRFLQRVRVRRSQVTSLMEMLETVMEEDGIDASEKKYLDAMDRELTKRFLALID